MPVGPDRNAALAMIASKWPASDPEGAVRDDEYADHRFASFIFCSTEAMNIQETSNPVWSWISRKQVGLVTFTSVR